MKITFVLPHAGMAGGVRVVAIYAERLHQRGHHVTVVSTPEAPVKLRERLNFLSRGKPVRRLSQNGSHFDGLAVPHFVIDSNRPITNEDVPDTDVVIATWWETAEWIAKFHPSKGIKCHFIQHYETWGGPAERVDAVWRLPFQRFVISNWLAKLARDQFGDRAAILIPNSVDMAQFYAGVRDKQDVPAVGFLYSTVGFKGVDVALQAIRRLQEVIPELKVIAFGADTPTIKLPLPLNTEFTHCPPQDSIRGIYAKCDVWLCASRSEGFGLPALEAMACRTPVVATRAGGFEDIVADGVNGFLVDIEDAKALAERALHLLRLPHAQWRRFSNAAYATAASYTWDDATDRLEAALTDLVAEQATISKLLSAGVGA